MFKLTLEYLRINSYTCAATTAFTHRAEVQKVATETKALDTQDLEWRVKEMYREVAEQPHNEFHFETGRALAERLGYPTSELDAIPAEAIDSFAGVGYYFDLAALQPAETVVDLGSGSGMDSFVAARQVGADGRVIGIDMTDAQVEKATRLAAAHGIGNVELRKAYIEELPLDSHSADVVISNGVINLSAAKDRVFAEAARVLRPGGRLAIADIVTATQLPEGVTCDAALWAACIGGAMQRDDYREAIGAAGFELDDLKENDHYRFVSERADNATRKYGVKSVSLLALKR
jgi:arsenite methyltransferase